MQDDVGAVRGLADGGMVEGIDFHNLGTCRRELGGPWPHLADDAPAGIAEALGGHIAQPAGRAENENAGAHRQDKPNCAIAQSALSLAARTMEV